MKVRKNRGRQVYKVLTSCPEAFMAHDTCRLSVGFYLGSKRRFVFHALFLNHSLPLISLLFTENTLSERVRHLCQRSIRSTPASFDLIRSLFSLVSNFFRSLCFFIVFHSILKKLYMAFCAPSPFLNPSVLGSVTTCRQCLMHQITSRSSVTGQVTKKCTHRVIEIQTI